MSTIAENITALTNQRLADLQSVENAKSAIRLKGVDVSAAAKLAELYDKISQIGNVQGSGTYLVRFFDFDGTIIKQQRVNAGESATEPIFPAHDDLKYVGLNNSITNVQRDRKSVV